MTTATDMTQAAFTPNGAQAPRIPDLGLGQKLAYACGDLASNLVWGLLLSFLMYYYTDIYVIPAAAVALLLFVPRVFDALLDPLIGYLVDRSGGRHVTRIMSWMAVPFGLSAFLCFLPLPLPSPGKFAWALVTYVTLGVVYSVVNTPYGVLSNLMAITQQERVSLNAFRIGGCQLGQLIVALLTLPAIAWLGGGNTPAQLRVGVTVLFGAIGVVSAGLWLVASRTCVVRRALPRDMPDLRSLLRALATNRRWYLANSLTFLNFMVFCSQGGMAIYYTRLVLGHPAHDASLLLGCSTVGALIGSISVPLLTARLGLRRTYLALLVWQALCLLTILAAGGRFVQVLGATMLEFMAIGPISPLCLAMLSGAVDEGRERTGISAAGLAFSCNTLVGKVASGCAGFLLAAFLAMGRYNPMATFTPPALTHWLKLGFVGLPLTAMALQFALVLFSRRE